MSGQGSGKPVRWSWLIVIWALGLIGVVAAIGLNGSNRQAGIMAAIGIIGFCVGLSGLWLIAFSRLPWKVRRGVAGLAIVAFMGLAGSVRYEGVSGDLEPIFRWRWSSGAEVVKGEAAVDSIGANQGFPQFLGATRNAHVPGIELARDWDAQAPELIWKRPIGEAWSGFAVQGTRAITQEQTDAFERIVQYDLLSGEPVWEHRVEARYDNPLGGIGPRSTPAISEGRVYALGATGTMSCLAIDSGEVIWEVDLCETYEAPLPDWGMASSPLVHEDRVIVNVGGSSERSLIALDKATGDFVWGGGNGRIHWSSPMTYPIAGKLQCLIFNKRGLTGHDLQTGEVLWEYEWTKSTGTPRVAIPVALPGDRIVISSGYGAGAAAIRIAKIEDGFEVEELWQSLHLKSKFNNFVYRDGYLYGLDDGMLACVDVETGRRAWKKGRYGHGQLLLGDDWLLLMAESGEAMLFEPTPEEPRLLGRFQALEGKSWNPPALVGPYLLVRNYREAACYRLPTL